MLTFFNKSNAWVVSVCPLGKVLTSCPFSCWNLSGWISNDFLRYCFLTSDSVANTGRSSTSYGLGGVRYCVQIKDKGSDSLEFEGAKNALSLCGESALFIKRCKVDLPRLLGLEVTFSMAARRLERWIRAVKGLVLVLTKRNGKLVADDY